MQEYVKQEAKANAAIENANAAAEEARTTAAATATNIVNSMKGQPNGIASINSNGELEQAPPQSVMFLAAHPVGSLFETTVSTNPGTLYGGTLAAWGGGRTPVGVNTADTSFNTVEKTGGEKAHTLTVGETPSHSHLIYDVAVYGLAITGLNFASIPNGDWKGTAKNTEATGGGQAHNNLQPYITCYIWKRTT